MQKSGVLNAKQRKVQDVDGSEDLTTESKISRSLTAISTDEELPKFTE